MKIRKSLLSFACAMLLALGFTACTDWGEQDGAAGNQVYPERQVLTTYDFEYSEDKPELSDMLIHNDVCEVVKDDYLGSNVLHLTGMGGAKIANPFNNVKLQNGAAITFYVKVDCAEGEEMDLTRPLFSFGSEEKDAKGNDASARFYFTPNGQLVYSRPGQLESLNLNENDPASYKTGILTPNEWHFVALQLGQKGYQLYVDGKKSLSGYQPEGVSATTFSYQTLLDSIQSLPYLYLGTTSAEFGAKEQGSISLDNVTLIRNQMNEKDWNKVPTGNGGGNETFKLVDYVNGESPTTEIGTSDCSADWWTNFSDYYRVPAGATLHLKFENHTSGAGNWNNWNICVATDDARNVGNYAEHFVMRSDLFGWGGDASTYNAANITNEGYGDWDQFRADMEGAKVNIQLQRKGDEIYMTAVATAKNGTVYKEMYHQTIGTDMVRAFLIADHSYLKLDANNCYLASPVYE